MGKKPHKTSAGRRRRSTKASAGPEISVARFTALTDEQWQPISLVLETLPRAIDARGAINRIGGDYWDARGLRERWLKRLKGKQPATQRDRIESALKSIRHAHMTLDRLLKDGVLDDDFVYPDFESPENRLEAWLSQYGLWVQHFAGKNDPIQAELEQRLMGVWTSCGGKLRWSRKKDDATTPYAPLIDFLTLALNAILGKTMRPSGVAKMIDRHRRQPEKVDPFLMYAIHHHRPT